MFVLKIKKIVTPKFEKPNTKSFVHNIIKFTKGPIPSRDNCIITTAGDIGIITSFLDNGRLLVKVFHKEHFFTNPFDSRFAGIYKILHSPKLIDITKKSIQSKVIIITHNENMVAIKMLG